MVWANLDLFILLLRETAAQPQVTLNGDWLTR